MFVSPPVRFASSALGAMARGALPTAGDGAGSGAGAIAGGAAGATGATASTGSAGGGGSLGCGRTSGLSSSRDSDGSTSAHLGAATDDERLAARECDAGTVEITVRVARAGE